MSVASATSAIATQLVIAVMLAASLAMPRLADTVPTVTVTPVDTADRYGGAIPWELPEDAERMVVERVTDGDTVRLTRPGDNWYEPTRIIGIQAPETDGPYTDEQCYGDEATAFLSRLLPEGGDVHVQRDRSNRDRNGRLLRHLFVVERSTGDAYLVAEILVLGGYAVARSYPPDDLYDDVLREAEGRARQTDAGIWSAC
jgi:micrococcal nuclease